MASPDALKQKGRRWLKLAVFPIQRDDIDEIYNGERRILSEFLLALLSIPIDTAHAAVCVCSFGALFTRAELNRFDRLVSCCHACHDLAIIVAGFGLVICCLMHSA